MKRTVKFLVGVMSAVMMATACLSLAACNDDKIKVNPDKSNYNVGICQLITHEALDAATEGFKDALRTELEKEGRTVTFDYQNAAGDSTICTTIANKFVNNDVDLILANATPALQAAANATKTIPVLGTSITDYATALNLKNFDGVIGNNISGTSDLAPLKAQADMIRELVPSASTVGLLYCSAEPNSQYQCNLVKGYLEEANISCRVYTFSDTNDFRSVAERVNGECDVIYVPTDNTVANNADTLGQIATIPVVAGEEGICKKCGIATLSINYYNLGVVTGKMAAKILLGKEDVTKTAIAYDENPVYKYNPQFTSKYSITVPDNYISIAD